MVSHISSLRLGIRLGGVAKVRCRGLIGICSSPVDSLLDDRSLDGPYDLAENADS